MDLRYVAFRVVPRAIAIVGIALTAFYLFVAASLLNGCSDEASSGTCPAELGARASWSYAGTDDRCSEIADALDAAGGLDSDSGMCGVQISTRVDGEACAATITSSCDDVDLRATCNAKADGAASCSAKLSAAGLSCDLQLEIRP